MFPGLGAISYDVGILEELWHHKHDKHNIKGKPTRLTPNTITMYLTFVMQEPVK